jgi:hypothetical protein
MHGNSTARSPQDRTEKRETKRVVHYERASTDEQTYSVPGQLRLLREHSQRHEHVIAIIRDEGRRDFEMVANGESSHAVSREFEQARIPNPSGSLRLGRTTIRNIVQED